MTWAGALTWVLVGSIMLGLLGALIAAAVLFVFGGASRCR
jgi:hypothetical protein